MSAAWPDVSFSLVSHRYAALAGRRERRRQVIAGDFAAYSPAAGRSGSRFNH